MIEDFTTKQAIIIINDHNGLERNVISSMRQCVPCTDLVLQCENIYSIQFKQFISEYKIPYTYELWYSEVYNAYNKL